MAFGRGKKDKNGAVADVDDAALDEADRTSSGDAAARRLLPPTSRRFAIGVRSTTRRPAATARCHDSTWGACECPCCRELKFASR